MGRRQGDSGLRDKTDDEIRGGARDRALPKRERRRYLAEEKFRGLRNIRKRDR